VAPIAGGALIGAITFSPALSFKAVYIVCGLAGIVTLILILKLKTPTEKEPDVLPRKELFALFRMVISNRFILITSAVEASILFAYGTFETFLPLYAIKVGLTAYEIGIFLSAQIIVLALTKPMMGKFSDKHGRKPQIFVGTIIGSICIGSFFFFQSFIPLLILSIVFGFCISIVTSATAAFIADLSNIASRGSAMGTLGSIMDIGHTTGPIVAGIIALYFGLGYSFIGASIMLLFIAIVFGISVIHGR
jgi:MFS family permease